ncbi:MAG: SLBB domain-containing protein [Candidatus Izemoplasmatales bacterium]
MKKYFGYIIIIVGIIGFLYFGQEKNQEVEIYKPYQETVSDTSYVKEEAYFVEIRGEVKFPGVYQIEEDEIVMTLINLAGGLMENADISEINLASRIEDGMQINIPSLVKESFSDTSNTETFNYIYVDIKGEVSSPGVYKIKEGTRVFEAIDLAGGLTQNADVTNLNTSLELYDGIMINIPAKEIIEKILVTISGEINNPNIYEIPKGSNMSDLIKLAGGLKHTADLTKLNLSRDLVDGDIIFIEKIIEKEKIYVSIKGEINNPGVYLVDEDILIKDLINLAGGLTESADPSNINFNQTLVLGSVVFIPSEITDDYRPIDFDSELININTASLEELQTLKGIGEILGQRIIDYRNEFGDFNSIEEIQFVSGIKTTVYEQIKDFITVG